jgi:cell wall-associated NlpC family hydrolase
MMQAPAGAVKVRMPKSLIKAAGYDDNSGVLRLAAAAWCVMIALAVTGCASSGAVPRPRPFPGAAIPPTDNVPPAQPAPPPTASAPDASAPAPSALVATALTLRGTPYRNGGSDPSGFDCSGFVQWVFAQHGTRLPREVRDQFRTGREIDEDEIRPGDLVFFETVSKGASHVGIAIGGDQFVHAPSSRGVVRIERFTSSYWGPRWVGARRVAEPEDAGD